MDTLFAKEFNGLKALTSSDVITVLVKYKPTLKSEVLEKYEYSNIGYQLLASVIEKTSGQSYSAFIRKNIFKPLKMNNSFIYGEKINPNIITEGHYFDDSLKTVQIANTILDYKRFKIQEGIIGGKGIYSTTNDLLKWINNFSNNKLVSREGFSEMTTRAILRDSSKTEYGFGYELSYWKDYSTTIGHSGRWPGYSSIFECNSKNKKAIVILQNFNYPSHLSEVNKILYNIQPVVYIKLSKSETDKFVGEYKNSTGSIKNIVAENEKIYAQMNPSVKLELRPISKNTFVVIGFQPEVQYEFIEENGKVIKYILRQPETGTLKETIRL
jgi:CubicO group peptidase (beta-lactamase class C family)